MAGRFVSIWFRSLTTDWFTIRQPHLKALPFVLKSPSHGRMIITAANATAQAMGVEAGMVVTDARAVIPNLEAWDDKPGLEVKLLRRIAEWCIRFTPVAAPDIPDGILLDSSGCSQLWGGDDAYVAAITRKLRSHGYNVRVAMADTPGVAWAVARFGNEPLVIPGGMHPEALLPLPPEALRLEKETVERLHKLGLHHIRQFIHMPRASLRRRFGLLLQERLDMATGKQPEPIDPVQLPEPYHERLPCLEPVTTRRSIEIALEELLKALCLRLRVDQKGLRTAIFKAYRTDGKIVQAEIGTSRPSHSIRHLFHLFEIKLGEMEPGLGIELFILEAPKVEDYQPQQQRMWEECGGLEDIRLSELIDRLAGKVGMQSIHRYVPEAHYWPERSLRPVSNIHEAVSTPWPRDRQRPLLLLSDPESIEVTAPIPDYPPMLFRHRGKLHKIVKADGPERIEQEWWMYQGAHRDYYRVEDEDGNRYWVFRLGHYEEGPGRWFLHGFFA